MSCGSCLGEGNLANVTTPTPFDIEAAIAAANLGWQTMDDGLIKSRRFRSDDSMSDFLRGIDALSESSRRNLTTERSGLTVALRLAPLNVLDMTDIALARSIDELEY